ncbi:MAG: PAS domain S-box protein [Ferruginibacter sp.]
MEMSLSNSSFLSTLKVFSWITSDRGRLIFIQDGWQDFVLASPDFKDDFYFVFPADKAQFSTDFKNAIEAHESILLHCRVQLKTGQIIWIEFKGAPAAIDSPMFSGYVGTCYSVQKAPPKLLPVNITEQFFLKHCAIMLLLTPHTGEIISVNRAAIEFYGYKEQHLLSSNIKALTIIENDEERLVLNNIIAGKSSICVCTHRLANGSHKMVEISATQIDLQDQSVIYFIVNDISSREEISEQLITEYASKDALINTTNDYIFSVDKSLRLTASNTAYLNEMQKLVLNPPFKIGDHIFDDLEYEEEQKSLWQSLYNRALSGEYFIAEMKFYNKEAHLLRFTEETFNPIWLNGAVIGVAVHSKEISHRRKFIDDISANKKLLESLVQNVKVGVLIQGPKSEIILNNKEALELLDFTQDQLLGKSSFDPDWRVERKNGQLFPGDEHPVPMAIKTLKPVVNEIMHVYRPKQKNWIWLQVDAIPVFNDDATLNFIVCSFIDISDRIKKELELQASNDKINKLSNQLPGAIFEMRVRSNMLFQFEFCSSGIYDLLGVSARAILESSEAIFSRIYPEDVSIVFEQFKNASMTLLPVAFEARFMMADGEVHWYYISCRPEKLGNGEFMFYGFISDINDRKLADEQLRKLSERFYFATLATSDGIYEWDIITDEAYWSEGYKRIFEIDIKGNYASSAMWLNKIVEPLRKPVLDSLLKALESTDTKWVCEYKFQKSETEWIDVVDNAIITRNEMGKAIRVNGALKDISIQKREEEQLRLFESVIKNSNDIIMIAEAKNLQQNEPPVIYVNDTFEKVTGYSKQDILGKSHVILHGIETDEQTKEYIRKGVLKGETVQTDILNYKKNRQPFWNSVFISPVTNLEGEISHWISIQRDVTKEKLSELEKLKLQEEKIAIQAIEESEKRYSQLVNSLHEITFSTDANAHWVFLNQAWEKETGYSIEESLGKPVRDFLHPDDIIANREELENIIQKKLKNYKTVVRYISKSKSIIWMDLNFVITYDEYGQMLSTSGTLRNITREKQNQHYYDLLANHVNELICVHNLDLTFLYVSPSIKEMMGYEVEELENKSFADFIHPEDVVRAEGFFYEFKPQETESYAQDFIARYKKKNGNYAWVETYIYLFFDDYSFNRKLVSTSRIIDKRIIAEKEILAALEMEKNLNEMKSQFISTASHEFKTPLTVIKSTIEVLKAGLDRGRSVYEMAPALSIIDHEVNELTTLINDILLIEKQVSNRIEFKPEIIDFELFLTNVIQKVMLNQKDGRRVHFIGIGGDVLLMIDPKLMDKVISNLLSNAFKYSVGRPGPKVTLTRNLDRLFLSVKDSGIGIPASDINQLFTPFYRAKNVGVIEGTGLGLRIVKNFIKMHQGDIQIKSVENEGSEFIIELPLT